MQGSIKVTRASDGTNQKKHSRTRNLASVIGEIQYTKAQFKRGVLHTKMLQKLKDKEVASRGRKKQAQLNKSAIPDITWWINKLAQNQPLCFTKPNRWITVQTYASSSGCGAILIRENQEKVFAHGEWKDNTVTMYCLNKGKGSITIAPLLVKVIQMRRLSNQERSPLEDAQGTWDLDLYRYI
ncbi:MAG: hypothetical protein EZS28_005479 [Streblomastix strix]|uniref:Uncharacterized protein n=1 Tax=Streblomastix strix TaxID=222440 RepID=A0A5J4WVY6_9EUKA|nr:MAG: hypothetical protein EZS28_005479 [Streblomastix strix]